MEFETRIPLSSLQPVTGYTNDATRPAEKSVASSTAPSPSPKAMATAMGEKLAAELEVFEKVAAEVRRKVDVTRSAEVRRKLVVEIASELFGVAPTWVAFFREVFARDGVIQALFAESDRKGYESSAEHSQVLEMLTTLRSRDLPENDPSESQRMITVRIPKCVHDYICDEANALDVSVNKLCISRLLQRSDERMIPTSQQKRRGRKPGSAGSVSSNQAPAQAPAQAPLQAPMSFGS